MKKPKNKSIKKSLKKNKKNSLSIKNLRKRFRNNPKQLLFASLVLLALVSVATYGANYLYDQQGDDAVAANWIDKVGTDQPADLKNGPILGNYYANRHINIETGKAVLSPLAKALNDDPYKLSNTGNHTYQYNGNLMYTTNYGRQIWKVNKDGSGKIELKKFGPDYRIISMCAGKDYIAYVLHNKITDVHNLWVSTYDLYRTRFVTNSNDVLPNNFDRIACGDNEAYFISYANNSYALYKAPFLTKRIRANGTTFNLEKYIKLFDFYEIPNPYSISQGLGGAYLISNQYQRDNQIALRIDKRDSNNLDKKYRETIVLINANNKTSKEVRPAPNHIDGLYGYAGGYWSLSPNGKTIAYSKSDENQIKIWSIAQNSMFKTIKVNPSDNTPWVYGWSPQ